MTTSRPIGVFDSGLGGLSIVQEIRHRMPGEDMQYVADSRYCPYGGRPLDEIRERSISVTRALIDRGAKTIVVACNTASGAAIEVLRETFALPIVGLEPAVKPAVTSTRAGRIAVLATPATLQTARFNRLVDHYAAGVHVLKIACPGFVELVESGEVDGPRALGLVRDVLQPAVDARVDRVVLGCTHYPFLRHLIAEVVGPGVEILDSGAAVARQVQRVLASHDLLNSGAQGKLSMMTTGDPALVEPIARRLCTERFLLQALSS